jgi:hypothetical protein
MIRNVHERVLDAAPSEAGALIDGLAGEHDRLWPSERWPAMRLDRPLAVGRAAGMAGSAMRSAATSRGAAFGSIRPVAGTRRPPRVRGRNRAGRTTLRQDRQ